MRRHAVNRKSSRKQYNHRASRTMGTNVPGILRGGIRL